jgi:hypothetical protein
VALGIAEGLTLESAVARARLYVLEAIRLAPVSAGARTFESRPSLGALRAQEERGGETLH